MNKKIVLLFVLASLMLMTTTSCGSKSNVPASKTRTTKKYNSKEPKAKKVVKLVKKSGVASYYADKFNGKRTASGEVFNNSKQTAAHNTLPFGTYLKVTNLANGKWVEVRVNDRGPFAKGRDIDLSQKAFKDIAGSLSAGTLKVRIEIVE